MKRVLLILVGLSVALTLLNGCINSGEPLRHNPDSPNPVIIGAILPLSGKNADYGSRLKDGIELCAEELNAAYGVGDHRIVMKYFDSESNPQLAQRAVAELIGQGAVGLLVGYDTDDVKAALPEIDRLQIPSVAPMATNDQLLGASKYLYLGCFTDLQQARALAAYAWYWRKLLRMAVLIDEDDTGDYSQSVAHDTAQAFRDHGGSITKIQKFSWKKNNVDQAIVDVLSTAPQAVVIPAEPVSAGKMIRKLRQSGYHGLLLGPDNWDEKILLSHCGPRPGDCAFIGLFSPEYQSSETRKFVDAYRRKFGLSPSSCEAQGYDALKLLAIGLNKARTMEEFSENMTEINRYPGAAGSYTIPNHGSIDRTIYIKTLRPARLPGELPTSRLSKGFSSSMLDSLEN